MRNPTIILLCFFFLFSCQSAEEIKRNQYFVEGLELYKTHCANCHQLDGKGLEGLYPPISSEYLSKNKIKIICGIRHGINDTLTIDGKTFNQAMPGNANLEPLEVAEITTYIYNKWGDETIITDVNEVKEILNDCKK
jgi:cytochrome c551